MRDSEVLVGSLAPVLATDPITPDYHGPQDMMNPGYAPHKRVWDVTGDLLNGRVTNSEARAGLRKALDKADAVKPHEGKTLGRAIKGHDLS